MTKPCPTRSAESLASRVRRGLVWSTLSSMVLRLGSLALGIVLARLLAPEDFGIYAIALTVQSILMTVADLGMSADLVRAEDPARRAPTVATLSLVSGICLALMMSATAGPAAALMGVPDAADVIMVLSLTLVVSGAGVVPYAHLQREFEQRKLFGCSVVDFVVGTTATVGLIGLGMGPMALALGRVAAQLAATSLQFVLSRLRPHFSFDRAVARSALAYGLPLAAANLLSWALLNIDNVVIARIAGVTSLGFYVLAFNISNWPISAIGQSVRAVSLAGFSHAARESDDGDRSLETALSLTWTVAMAAGVLLAALAHPLIVLLYGERWAAAAAVLVALGAFGALRVVLDLLATYLMAQGAARPVLYVQILWFVTLIPATAAGVHWLGIKGAGWAHLAVVGVRDPARLRGRAESRRHLAARPPPCGVATAGRGGPDLVDRPYRRDLDRVAGARSAPRRSMGCLTYAAVSYPRIRKLLPARGRASAATPARIDQPALEAAT